VDSAGDLDLVAVRRELREERQRRELLQAHAVSGVLAAVLMASWVWPFDDDAALSRPGLAGLAGWAIVWVVAQWAVSESADSLSWTRRTRLVAVGLAIPVALVAWGAVLLDDHRTQRDAGRVFDAYTHRFPRDYFTETSIVDRIDRFVTVCGSVRGKQQGFCTEVNLTRPRGRQVQGGYRFAFDDPGFETEAYLADQGYSTSGWPIEEPFDCFGLAIKCSR
jgi:hypothetical protein